MMAMTNSTESGTQIKASEKLVCYPTFDSGLEQPSIQFFAVNILLSFKAFWGNYLILAAFYKESLLYPPFKLFYRCLETTDLFVGLITQTLYATHWTSLVKQDWNLCRCTYDAAYITGYTFCSVSLLTTTAISVNRPLAVFSGLNYKQIVTLKRVYVAIAIFGLHVVLQPYAIFQITV